jgi:3-phosphoshikimate 1-carboxyvinyltransferase
MEAFGLGVEDAEDAWLVESGSWAPPHGMIDCGNSGSTLRFLCAQAALLPATVELTGDASLRKRPNAPLLAALKQLGAVVQADEGRAPITLRGPIKGGEVRLPGGLSSQFASALLLALPFAEGESVLTVESPVRSRPYLDLTLAMAQSAGLNVLLSEAGNGDLRLLIPGSQVLRCAQLVVGGDWSSAALLLVAVILSGGQIELQGLDVNSAQGDRRIVDILQSFGAVVEHGESLVVGASDLVSPGRVDVSQTPDLFPPLCAVAAYAQGTTVLEGSPGLRHKECDRIAAMSEALQAAGIDCRQRGDGLVIKGGQPEGAALRARGDHRVHMALVALALGAKGQSQIDSAWSTVVSYPNFHSDLLRL